MSIMATHFFCLYHILIILAVFMLFFYFYLLFHHLLSFLSFLFFVHVCFKCFITDSGYIFKSQMLRMFNSIWTNCFLFCSTLWLVLGGEFYWQKTSFSISDSFPYSSSVWMLSADSCSHVHSGQSS